MLPHTLHEIDWNWPTGFVCLCCCCFTSPSTLFSHVGTIFCLPGSNQSDMGNFDDRQVEFSC